MPVTKNRTPAVLRLPLLRGHECHPLTTGTSSYPFSTCFCGFLASCHIQRTFPALVDLELAIFSVPFSNSGQQTPSQGQVSVTLVSADIVLVTFSLDCFKGRLQTPVLSLGASGSLQELVDTLSN